MIDKIIPKKMADETHSNHQRLFMKYTLGVLVDLTVLGLFDEYCDYVVIDSFSLALLAAVLLQVSLKATLVIEHRISHYFKSKSGVQAKVLRFFSVWAVLFVSKLLILEAINLACGDHVLFKGIYHGVLIFVIVVTAILLAEAIMKKIYDSLA